MIRPEISSKNIYHISKHRYYELKHFCLQYSEWKDKILATELSIHGSRPSYDGGGILNVEFSDSVGNQAIKLSTMKSYCEMVESTVMSTDSILAKYILLAVTKDISFNTLKTKYGIPCERDMYYNRYRKFFWLLSQKR